MPVVRRRGVAGGTWADAPFTRPFVRPFIDTDPLRAAGAETDVGRVEAELPLGLSPVVGPARCVDDETASSPTRLLLLSAFGFSGTNFIEVR